MAIPGLRQAASRKRLATVVSMLAGKVLLDEQIGGLALRCTKSFSFTKREDFLTYVFFFS